MTRAEAIRAGLNRYMGQPCKYGHSGLRQTYDSHCVECRPRKYKEDYTAHGDKRRSAANAYDKANPDQHRARVRRWEKKVPGRKAAISKRHREMNPDKTAAREELKRAVRSGKLQRLPCECGATKTEAHHSDYTKPLDVIWMCSVCHHKHHNGRA